MPDGWRDLGRADGEIRDAVGLGLSPDELRSWDGFHPLEVYWAKKHGLSLDEARRWAERGVPVRDAVMATGQGLTRDDVARWLSQGFSAGDAAEAGQLGVGMAEAIAWREVGFIAPDAYQLIRDGWKLEDARVARHRDVNRYGRRHG